MSYNAKLPIQGKTVEVSVDTGNAAFYNNDGKYAPAAELRAIKRRLAEKVSQGETEGRVRDTNGNTVGTWKIAS